MMSILTKQSVYMGLNLFYARPTKLRTLMFGLIVTLEGVTELQ